ncbi:MAG: hypothetical protein J0I06_21080 [Planctomycetes bacterium]|nr:hypothetical protein [Planctomycetota bacterium]
MSTGAEQPPAGGLKSALKIAVPLAALVAVVFAVAFFSQYTTPEPDEKKGPDNEGPRSNEPPLRFFTSARHWDPPLMTAPGYRNFPLLAPSAVAPALSDDEKPFKFNFSLPDRVFQGVYEPSQDRLRTAQFWFENRNPQAVTMQLKGVSCSACTGGRVAGLAPEVTSRLLRHSALAALPIGPFNPFGVGLTQPLGSLALPPGQGGLQWTEYGFSADPNATFRVPAATNPDKWSPQWGILELKFKVLSQPGDSPKPIGAVFATKVENGPEGGNEFSIAFSVARAFDIGRPNIDAGRIDPLSGERPYEVLVYSATRGPGSEFGDLEPPVGTVEAPGGSVEPVKFVEVMKVERVPEAELADVAERLAAEHKRLTPVRAAYRLTVVVRPKVGETRMDIGLFERTLNLTAGGVTVPLPVKATVRGGVWVDGDRTEFDLGTFSGGPGTSQTIELTTEKAGTELAVVKDQCEPSKLVYELEKQPDRGGRGYYKLKVTVPPGQVFGSVKGVVVLEVKGPNPQRMRLPFRGTGSL